MAAVLIGGLLLVAASRPDTFEVRRTASIKAPPERIFPLINDLHAFNSWNPYEKKDPNIKGTYGRITAGKGAAYAFDGNRDVGRGRIEIVDSSPVSRVTMSVSLVEPLAVANIVHFTLVPSGDATNVTWEMRGDVPYVAKVVHMFVDPDDMVGRDFEAGLASLKSMVESTKVAVPRG
ncbi:MAG: SRPBCC family protein [Alphaproteobacteria bacterium]